MVLVGHIGPAPGPQDGSAAVLWDNHYRYRRRTHMSEKNCSHDRPVRAHCCPCDHGSQPSDWSRRGFLGGMGGMALGGMALTGLSWSALSAADPELPAAPPRKPLNVKPVLIYDIQYRRAPQTSWRPWGGLQTQEDVDGELARITQELEKMKAAADFPVNFLPVAATQNAAELASMPEVASADVLLVYACDGDLNAVAALKKDTIFFVRHKSGPVYLYYEIISPRFLRQHTDELKTQPIDDIDVVVDSQDEILWRLRSLCGLNNTRNSRMLCIGGPAAWAQPAGWCPTWSRSSGTSTS